MKGDVVNGGVDFLLSPLTGVGVILLDGVFLPELK